MHSLLSIPLGVQRLFDVGNNILCILYTYREANQVMAKVLNIGILASTPIFNTFAMKHPVEGKAVTMKDYFAGDAKTHFTGMLGGFIWMGGMVISFMGAGAASNRRA